MPSVLEIEVYSTALRLVIRSTDDITEKTNMQILAEISDNRKLPQGVVRLRLDWPLKQWTMVDDPHFLWREMCFENNGRFEVKENRDIRMFDRSRHILTFCDAPTGGHDILEQEGTGQLFDPVDRNFKGGTIRWSVELMPSVKEVGAVPALSPFRQYLLARLSQLLPCKYGDQNYKVLCPDLTKEKVAAIKNYSTCGSLPGFVTLEMGQFKGYTEKKALDRYMNRYSLNGTNLIRSRGIEHNCWRECNLIDRPLPGDLYGLLDLGKHDRKRDGFCHVGVIQESSADVWKTMDLGAGPGGFDGAKDVARAYNADAGELWGESNQGGGYRVLAGWVDVDAYLKIG